MCIHIYMNTERDFFMNEIYYSPEEIAQCTQAKIVTETNINETDNWLTHSGV